MHLGQLWTNMKHKVYNRIWNNIFPTFYLCHHPPASSFLSVCRSIHGIWTLFILCVLFKWPTSLSCPCCSYLCCCFCSFMPKWCRNSIINPHTVVLLLSLCYLLWEPHRTCKWNGELFCNMLFYFPIFDLLKMQISIELVLWGFSRLSHQTNMFFNSYFSFCELQIFNFPPIWDFWTLWLLFCQFQSFSEFYFAVNISVREKLRGFEH